ncbi:MAM and LDL-receptor class A domain-containing protein 1-like [Dendronephthya gigantea]|uniref:MAM and LDL-receptor class A domain-containing protein 1-like n=1 Tax=Dendronephthya gigantea TaxID=151771 RepID=UPI00106D205E|nr:MAM and LDL-receptor class A domain-containing protein 1-like [Dendronephthya gigantea]
MSSIVTGILSSTVGLLWNKVRDSTADKLKDGDVTDAEIREIVVRELNDIKSKIDGLSRSTLLASYNFLEEGVELLSVSLDKSNPEQKASETQDEPAPVAGHWGRWSSWTECDENCKRHRSRKCSDPAPMHGGKNCPGVGKEEKDCYTNSTCNPDNCDFTRGSYCHWTRYKNIYYFWQAHKGSTPTRSTGPNQDHTTGTGHYIFTESSFPAKENDTALLTSKLFPPSQCRCISWYYHMYGRSMGELSVYIKDPVGSKRIIWDKKGDQGNRWILDSATISNVSTTSYQVEFEAIRGRSFYSDMALDDIHFKEMPCGVQHLGCFNDRYKRALPDLIANLRDKIDWYDMQKTVRECACVAYDKGYKYFAVQFYGECWGARSMIEYDKYGASNDCWSGVGKDFTNYVYKFTQ